MFKQQSLAKNLSAFVFAAAMILSLSSFGQALSDGIYSRAVFDGMELTYLQNAVILKTSDSSPLQLQKIKVNGDDERLLASATTYTEAERKRYSGIGRIECPTQAGKIAFGTGFHVRDFKTMMTAAHVFRDPRDGSKLNPSSCSVVFYNPDGTAREVIGIRNVKSRWDDPVLDQDRSNDIALIRLNAESKAPEQIASLRYAETTESSFDVTLVGFHAEMPTPAERKIMRQTHGRAMRAPPDSFHILVALKNHEPLKNPENLLVGSYDSGHGTSGAPIFNSIGKIIGLNQGATDDMARPYNSKTSYNLGIRFDESLREELNLFVSQP